MKLKTKNISSILFKKNLYLMLFIFFFMLVNNNISSAEEEVCKGPADVMIVIDHSANMTGSKFDDVKNASVDFIYKNESGVETGLFSIEPNAVIPTYNYHQVGLVAFNNNVDVWPLYNDNDNQYQIIQDIIVETTLPEVSDPNGVLQNAVGSSNVTEAIGSARNRLNVSANNEATKTIIILISGSPDNLSSAIDQVRIVKENDPLIRTIAIGVNFDEIADDEKRENAINFISNQYIFPNDCHYTISNPEVEPGITMKNNPIENCNYIEGSLDASLESIYNDITAAVCDDSAPTLTIFRVPSGTLYSVDEFTIFSNAGDNFGFSEHYITWYDLLFPDDKQIINDCSLFGKDISCNTGEIGPFSAGKTINYNSVAVDMNNNSVEIDPVENAKIASVSITPLAIFRNKDNLINVTVSDPEGMLNSDEKFYIRVENGDTNEVIISEEAGASSEMSCSGTGSSFNCTYNLNPGCAYEGVYTDSSVNIYVYAQNATGFHGPLDNLNRPLGHLINCGSGIDSNCNGTIDSDEASCDTGNPIVTITRTDPVEGDDVYDDNMVITLKSEAGDPNGIKRNTIYYKIDGGATIDAFSCNDGNGDGFCDEDGQSVESVETTITLLPFTSYGMVIEYWSEAVDYSGNPNLGATLLPNKYFVVKSRECGGVGDGDPCNDTADAICCGSVCNKEVDAFNGGDPPFEMDCVSLSCNGTRLDLVPDNAGTNCTTDDGFGTGCYTQEEVTGVPGGCQDRKYRCDTGRCEFMITFPDPPGFTVDTCNDTTLNNYGCFEHLPDYLEDGRNGKCKSEEEEFSGICDFMLPLVSVNAYSDGNNLLDAEDIFISGTSTPDDELWGEVLDNRNVIIEAGVSDIYGIDEFSIFWREVDTVDWNIESCILDDSTCDSDRTLCSCEKNLGTFPAEKRIEYYAQGTDVNLNIGVTFEGETPDFLYSFRVRNSDCYNITLDESNIPYAKEETAVGEGEKPDLTSCGDGSGMCCGGTCNDEITNISFFSEGCYDDACSGNTWVANVANSGLACGDLAETCFDHYNGCKIGNKCYSGYCSPDLGSHTDSCNNDLLTDYGCDGGTCGLIESNMNCSIIGNYDGDDIDCNCDCNGYDIEEKVYSSLEFDGYNDYVDVGSGASLDITGNQITIEAWIYPKSLSKSYVVSKFNGDNVTSGYNLLITQNDFYFELGDGATEYQFVAAHGMSINTWYHVVGVYDGKSMKIYKNGVELAGSTPFFENIVTNSYNVNIGRRTGVNSYKWNGYIDDVRIYNCALYPEEVQDHYNGIFNNNTSLVGHWEFDGDATDSSGNENNGNIIVNNNGTLHGNVVRSDDGKYGKAAYFDGSSDYIILKDSARLKRSGATLSWWSKADSTSNTGIFSNYLSNYLSLIELRSDRIYAETNTNSNYFNFYSISKTTDWTFYSIVFDSSEAYLYINGSFVKNADHSSSLTNDTSIKYMGSRTSYSGYFKGLLDEVSVYDRALTAAEIEQLKAGIYVNDSSFVGYWNFDENAGSIAYDTSDKPKWKKHYNGSTGGASGNVPLNWQVCTDNKDNDCDGYDDEYDTDNLISSCDGSLDSLSIKAEALDGTGENRVEFPRPATDVNDVDVSRIVNDFTLTAFNEDDFNIQQTLIEWTADNWVTTESATCDDIGLCEVCIIEEDCANNNIDLALLASGSTFKYRTCATDNSVNHNMVCTQDYTFSVTDTNNAPTVETFPAIDPDFCSAENLRYVLLWNFDDVDLGDKQKYYEVQVKEDNNDFDTGPLIINSMDGGTSNYYQIIKGSHSSSGTAELSPPVSLVDNDLTWVTDEWKNGEVKITSGPGSPQTKLIESNTEHEIFVNSWDIDPGSNFEYEVKSVDLEYGEKEYFWRVRVTDDNDAGFEKTSDWGYGPSFTTPLHKFPQIEFSANPVSDATKNCLYYETWPDDADLCKFGEDIIFHDETTFSAECVNSDSTQCLSADKARCDGFLCAGCNDDSQCDPKFGIGYVCIGGICDPQGFDCSGDSSNCKDASNAKCDSSVCVPCDEDLQCAKFTIKDEDDNDIEYICNAGKCEFPDHRKWDFYGDGYINSTNPNPINNYAGSVVNEYNVILKITDILGKDCSETMVIPFGGSRYPKWNEVSSSN